MGADDLMIPGGTLPEDVPLVLEARLSGSGQAIRQPGDRYGTSAPFTLPAAAPLRIVLDSVVP